MTSYKKGVYRWKWQSRLEGWFWQKNINYLRCNIEYVWGGVTDFANEVTYLIHKTTYVRDRVLNKALQWYILIILPWLLVPSWGPHLPPGPCVSICTRWTQTGRCMTCSDHLRLGNGPSHHGDGPKKWCGIVYKAILFPNNKRLYFLLTFIRFAHLHWI